MKRYAKGFIVPLLLALALVLAACGSKSGDSAPPTAYRVITIDESGAPVKGVGIQFCTDTLCLTGETDDNGIATFDNLDEGTHTVHVIDVPEGFADDETEYETPASYGDVMIMLETAE